MNGKSFRELLKTLVAMLLVSVIFDLTLVHAGVPKLISFEGKLTEKDGTPITGLREIRFRIYESEDSEIPIWVETRQVAIDNGFYNILLGSVNPLSFSTKFDTTYWLGIQVSGDSEMVPRYQFGAVPYAINADMVDGKDSMELIPRGVIVMWSGMVSEIPTGWRLCDGNEGTPDLRDRFILGISAGEQPGAKGGSHSITLSVAQLPPHMHSGITNSDGGHYHGLHRHSYGGGSISWSAGSASDRGVDLPSDGAHTHTLTTDSTGSGSPIDNRPAYYKLGYIMKL